MENNLEREIISIVSEVSGVDEDEIALETNLVEDLEIDSIKAIEIAVAIEKKYKVSVRDEDLPKLTTVKHIIDLTSSLISEGEQRCVEK
jgi:acyl carrier protein